MTTDNNDEERNEKKKLFYTTSDMMKTINKSIASLDSPDDAISPRVELQRRMPDGSTRRANEKDMEAADMDSKLKQVRIIDRNAARRTFSCRRLIFTAVKYHRQQSKSRI